LPPTTQFGKLKRKPLVLFSPLDWGLGHTTRSIPIIAHLLSLNCSVIIACNNHQKELLTAEFPDLEYFDIPGYEIHYGSSGVRTYLALLLQIPALLIKIREEQVWLQKVVREKKPDLIVSDNRYGLYSATIPSVLITHQLAIQTGLGPYGDKQVQKILYRFINRFTECWVPDVPGIPNASGILSHPIRLPKIPVRYLGCLSRFKVCRESAQKNFILILLSGPEPQRSIFEELILSQAQTVDDRMILIRGLQNPAYIRHKAINVETIDFAHSAELNKLMCEAKFIIARAGYTTVMDVLALQKKSVLVPTPGQTEQKYLARHLIENKLAYTISQQNFSLQKACDELKTFQYQFPDFHSGQYKEIINRFIEPRA